MTSDKSTTGLQTAHTRTHTRLHFDSRHQLKLSHTPETHHAAYQDRCAEPTDYDTDYKPDTWNVRRHYGGIKLKIGRWARLSRYCTHSFVGLFVGGCHIFKWALKWCNGSGHIEAHLYSKLDTYTNSYVSLCTYSLHLICYVCTFYKTQVVALLLSLLTTSSAVAMFVDLC